MEANSVAVGRGPRIFGSEAVVVVGGDNKNAADAER